VARKQEIEFDLQFLVKPETVNAPTTVTISRDKRLITGGFPLDKAMAHLREFIEGEVEEAPEIEDGGDAEGRGDGGERG
jgi:hypothetical protein